MRPDVEIEDSEDAPMAPVVDLLNSDEPMFVRSTDCGITRIR
jgi:hypothetical protein